VNVPVPLCKNKFSTKPDGNLLLLDNPGHVRSQITSVVCKIQQFNFDSNLVVVRKVIMGIPPALVFFLNIYMHVGF
jgi:hypothetical protein